MYFSCFSFYDPSDAFTEWLCYAINNCCWTVFETNQICGSCDKINSVRPSVCLFLFTFLSMKAHFANHFHANFFLSAITDRAFFCFDYMSNTAFFVIDMNGLPLASTCAKQRFFWWNWWCSSF